MKLLPALITHKDNTSDKHKQHIWTSKYFLHNIYNKWIQ